MKKYKITEIFYSLQGEGMYTGFPAIFIRFSGCNLKCDFCDTDHSNKLQMNAQRILKELKKYPCKRVVMTGGEPLLQLDVDLIDLLHDNDFIIHLETNGTIEQIVLNYIDWVTVSPKYKDWILKNGNELKVVYQGQALERYKLDTDFDYYFLQPCSMSNIQETIKVVKDNPLWNLSFQQQKVLNIE